MFGLGKGKKDKKEKNAEVKAEKILKKKRQSESEEPQYYRSISNIQTLNYRVYYMSRQEKILYTLLFMLAGMVVGYIVFGGMAKDEYGNPTLTTYAIDVICMLICGLIAVKVFIPVRTKQLLNKRKDTLKLQFRDFLDDLSTSLGTGKNIEDAFLAAENDLKNQYEEGAFIVNEIKVINAGLRNGAIAEDLIENFAERSGCQEIEDFANTFSVGYRKGSNIRDVVRSTNEILSDKMNVKQDIETMVTGSKMELNIMLLMPIGMIAMMKSMSADFASNFSTPTGMISMVIAIACCVLAYFMGQKILDFKI